MNIVISVGKEKYLLRSESKCFELCTQATRTDKGTGERRKEWVPEKWFGTLEAVFQCLLNMKLRASDATTFHELKRDIETFRAELMGFWGTEPGGGKTACSCASRPSHFSDAA